MRKMLSTIVAIGVAGFIGQAYAVDGDFELSGHVNAGFGGQHYDKAAPSGQTAGGFANPNGASNYGVIGDLASNKSGAGAAVIGEESLVGFVDEAELDATKTFGENVRARMDLSFQPVGTSAGAGVEQAYATLNIPVRNGIEFLVGRFDAPIGFESNERGENTLFSHSVIWRALRPTSLTGLKFYYPFSDMADLHFYIVNNLRDVIGATDSAMPSGGFRVGFSWGDEGNRSTVGVSGAGGPEVADGTKKGQFTYLGDLDWNIWFNEFFAFSGEAIYRVDNAAAAATDETNLAGTASFHYVFGDAWDGTLRYSYAQDKAGSASSITGGAGASLLDSGATTALKTTVHEVGLGIQYHVTDAAKIQFEGGYTMLKSSATKGIYGGVMNLAYSF